MNNLLVGLGSGVLTVILAGLGVIAYGLSQRRRGAAEATAATKSKTVEAIDAQNTAAARVAGRPVADSLRDGTF